MYVHVDMSICIRDIQQFYLQCRKSVTHFACLFPYNKILLEKVAGEIHCNNGISLYKLNWVLLEQSLLLRNLHPLVYSVYFANQMHSVNCV
jgi:hypothetical protein